MKKKIFVMGKVYYLAKQEICEIENEIQTDSNNKIFFII